MEHRERWWIEVDRGHGDGPRPSWRTQRRAGDTLRATQNRAEQSSLAVIDQQRIANDLELYANRFTALGRAMINNSEQKHWSIVTELSKARSDLARVETEAERKIRVRLLECESHAHGLELSARAADAR